MVRIQTLISVGDRERRCCRERLRARKGKKKKKKGKKTKTSAGREQRSDCENGDVKKKSRKAEEEVWDGDKTERWGAGLRVRKTRGTEWEQDGGEKQLKTSLKNRLTYWEPTLQELPSQSRIACITPTAKGFRITLKLHDGFEWFRLPGLQNLRP